MRCTAWHAVARSLFRGGARRGAAARTARTEATRPAKSLTLLFWTGRHHSHWPLHSAVATSYLRPFCSMRWSRGRTVDFKRSKRSAPRDPPPYRGSVTSADSSDRPKDKINRLSGWRGQSVQGLALRNWARMGTTLGAPAQSRSSEQERIVRLLVERVVVSEAGAEITLKLDGIAGLARDLISRAPEMRRAA